MVKAIQYAEKADKVSEQMLPSPEAAARATAHASRATAHAAIATAMRTAPVVVTVNEAPRRNWFRKK